MKHILIIFTLFLFSLTVISCSSDSGSSTTTSTTDNTTDDDNSTTTTVSEITQTLGNDGYYSGSFEVPENGISFLLATFRENINYVGKFYSLTDPDGTNILSSSSALYNKVSGSYGRSGNANVLVPQSPSFSAKVGIWTFKNKYNDQKNNNLTLNPIVD